MNVTKDEIYKARHSDLCKFLLSRCPDKIIFDGSGVRLKSNRSVSVKVGYTGFKDFATGETGNSIDFLMKYFGLNFVEAVKTLCKPTDAFLSSDKEFIPKTSNPCVTSDFKAVLKPSSKGMRNLFAYLTKIRKIPPETIRKLLNDDLIYQEEKYNNIVFINAEKDFAEIHGTLSTKSFHGTARGSNPDGYWWFKSYFIESQVKAALVCESAIDAVSLYLLNKAWGFKQNFLYCGIAGAGNQRKIDAIKRKFYTIIAVDNDEAGEECRKRNPDCDAFVPELKDWNEDWRNYLENQNQTLPS